MFRIKYIKKLVAARFQSVLIFFFLWQNLLKFSRLNRLIQFFEILKYYYDNQM